MQKSHVEYAALRYKSAKLINTMAMDVKAARVIVEQVDVEGVAGRVRKFRCPPGTRRPGRWTNSMGTTCNLGPVRAGLAKLGSAIERVAIGDGGKPPKAKRKKEKRTILGGIGKKLTAAADELATVEEIEEALKDKKKGKKRSFLGRKLTEAADVLATEDEIEAALREALAKKKGKDVVPGDGDKKPDVPSKPKDGPLALFTKKKKLLETIPDGTSDKDRAAYSKYVDDTYRDHLLAKKKGFPDFMDYEDWDADRLEKAKIEAEDKKKPKAPTSKKPGTPKPVADEDLPDFEMPSKVPPKNDPVAARQKYIARVQKDFDAKKKEVLSNRPDGITNAEWKAYKDDINSRKIKFGYGGADNIPDLPTYEQWKGKTEGDLPTPQTFKPEGSKKPSKPKKPTGPAKAAEAEIDVAAKKNEKNQGKKPKKLPGKQYGGIFKNEESAKQWGLNTALDRGKEIYVVKTENGKFRLVDKERFLAGDEEAVFAVGPDGSIIDLPDTKADADEIVLDVENAVEKIEEEVAEEIKDLAKLDGKLELTKSKTGLFLPDDVSPAMLDEYAGVGTNDAFVAEFSQQREEVLQFWDARLGDKKFDTSEDMLTAIDKLIADEEGKTPKNQKLLGVLRTERKNFAAMWVADKNGEDLDPYERFNYIQPKRRKAIIDAANVHGLVVGKKNIDQKEKIDLDPTVDLVPDDGKAPDLKPDTTPDVTPDETPEPKDLEIKPNGTAATGPTQPLTQTDAENLVDSEIGWNESHSKKQAAEWFKENGEQELSSYRESLKDSPSVIAVEKEKMEDDPEYWPSTSTGKINVQYFKLQDDLDKKKAEAQKHAENGELEEFEEKMTEVFEIQKQMQQNALLREEIIKRQNKSAEKELKASEVDAADIADTPDAVKAWDEYIQEKSPIPEPATKTTSQDWLDDKEWFDSLAEAKKNEFWNSEYPPEGDTSWMDTEDVINQHFDGLIATMDDQYNWNASYAKQLEDEGSPVPESVAKFFPEIEGMKQYYELKRQEALEGLKKKGVNVAETDKINLADDKNAGAVQSLFGTDIDGYDHKKLVDVEDAKLGDSLESIINRQNSKGKYTTDLATIVEKLPDNFDELSPEQQRLEILQAAGVADELQAAKIIARSAVVNRYGKNTTLTKLNDILANFNDPNLDIGGNLTTEISAARVESAKDRLAEVLAKTQKLSDPNLDPVTRLVFEGELNDARAELVSNLLIHHKVLLKEGDLGAISKNAQDLVQNKDLLPTKVNNGILGAFNKGIDVKKAEVFPKVAKGMPKPTDFDSTYLGSMQPDGSAIAYRIPLGYNGIFTLDDASERIATGAQLSEIPDELLFDAVKLNTGEGKRFSPLFDKANGFNETVGFVDGLTGKKFIVKLADRNDQEHTQEAAGSVLAQILGQPVTGMRFGSGIVQKPLPGHKAELEGKKMGDQRALVIEHVGNMFDPEKFEILSSPPSVSSGDIDPESLARLMVLDRSMNYFDRTAANVIAVRNKETGKVHLHPIDHGNGFYPFADGKDEMTYGFTKVTKGDNIPLHKYLENMSDEDRLVFASALRNATSRYKKANYEGEFTRLAEVQGLTDIERERLMKHAKFLEDRKQSLDWDKMSKDLFISIGFSSEDADDLLAGGGEVKAFSLPQDTPTLSNVGDKVQALPTKMSAGVDVLYDGGSIEGFSVNAMGIKVKGSDSLPQGFTAPTGDATQLVYKLRKDELESVVAGQNGWQFWRTGHLHPNGGQSINTAIDFDNPKTTAPASNNVQMFIKQLDDGTIIVVSKSDKDNNWNGTTRIIIPEKPSVALSSQDKITKIMAAAGVAEHGLPTAEQVRNLGIRRAASHLLGIKNTENMEIDELIAKLEAKGIDLDDIVLATSTDGKPSVSLTQSGVKKVMAANGIKYLGHSMGYGTSPSEFEKALVGMFTTGAMLSTHNRYNSGIGISGASSGSDVLRNGSDYVFHYPSTNEISSGISHNFYSLPEFALARLDALLTPGDDYGDPATRVGTLNTSGHQFNLQGSERLSTGIMVLSSDVRDSVIAKMKAKGIEDIDGVPLEMLIATPNELKEKFEALRKFWEDQGAFE